MRRSMKFLTSLIASTALIFALGTLAFVAAPAVAGTIKLKASMTQVDDACLANNATFTSGSGPGGYGCKTDKGEISCDKDGNCTGTCENCGGKAAPGKGRMGGILTNTPTAKAQPLQP